MGRGTRGGLVPLGFWQLLPSMVKGTGARGPGARRGGHRGSAPGSLPTCVTLGKSLDLSEPQLASMCRTFKGKIYLK